MQDDTSAKIRVSMPAKVISYDETKQVAVVQPLIRERINIQGKLSWVELPVLEDVAVCRYQGGNYVITMPVAAGDEVQLVFNDMSYDSWWARGDVQNWIYRRRHDLSDAMIMAGAVNSKPNKVERIPGDALEVRTKNYGTKIQLKPAAILLQKQDTTTGTVLAQVKVDQAGVELTGVAVRIAAATLILDVASVISESDDPLVIQANAMQFNALTTIALNGTLMINGNAYLSHRHVGVQTGGGTSGTVTP